MSKTLTFSKQQQRILQYLNDVGSITGGEAHFELGILNFSARLSELKDKGFKFKKVWEHKTNKYGKIKYCRYFLIKENEDI